jgi:peptidoglycan/LPS O-acetylase OafA/YrhL
MFLFPIGGVQPNVIWTLRHEFLFYGVFCLFAIYFKHQWKALILWFLSPFIWFSLGINSYLEPSAFRELCDFLFSKVNLLFGIGLLIAVLGMKGYLNFKVATKHTFLLSLLSVVPLFVISRYIGVGEELEYKQIIISGVISALVVIVGISLQASKPLTLFDRLGLKLGDASYSIYLIHTGVISVMFIIWPKLHLPVNPILVLAVGCVLCCLIGIAVHLYIEKPVIKLVQSKLEPAKVKH